MPNIFDQFDGFEVADGRSDLNDLLNESPETQFLGKPQPTPSPSPTPQPSRVAELINAIPKRALIAGDVTNAAIQNAENPFNRFDQAGNPFDAFDVHGNANTGESVNVEPTIPPQEVQQFAQLPANQPMTAEEMSRTGQTQFEPNAVTAGTEPTKLSGAIQVNVQPMLEHPVKSLTGMFTDWQDVAHLVKQPEDLIGVNVKRALGMPIRPDEEYLSPEWYNTAVAAALAAPAMRGAFKGGEPKAEPKASESTEQPKAQPQSTSPAPQPSEAKSQPPPVPEEYANLDLSPDKGEPVPEVPRASFYHASDADLPESFTVKNNPSSRTARTLSEEYGISPDETGLFASDHPDIAKPYGSKLYKVTADQDPIMLDNGKYIFPEGTNVSTELISPKAASVREALSLDEIRLMREKADLQYQQDLARRVGGGGHPAIDARIEQINRELDDIANNALQPDKGAPIPNPADLPDVSKLRTIEKPLGEQPKVAEPQERANVQDAFRPEDESRPLDNAPSGQVDESAGQQPTVSQQSSGVDAQQSQAGAQAGSNPRVGIAERYIEESIKRGELPPEALQKGSGWNPDEAQARGQKLINEGHDPQKILNSLKRDGLLSGDRMAALWAERQRLGAERFEAQKAEQARPNDPKAAQAARLAEQNELAFLKEARPLAGGATQKIMTAWQEAKAPDLANFDGLYREATKLNGGNPVPRGQMADMVRRAGRAEKAQARVRQSVDRLGAQIDRTLAKRATPSEAQLRGEIDDFVRRATPCK